MEQKTKSGFSLYVNSNENIQNALFLREKKKKYRIGFDSGAEHGASRQIASYG